MIKTHSRLIKILRKSIKSWKELTDAPRNEIEKTIKVAGLGKQKSAAIKNFLVTFKKE